MRAKAVGAGATVRLYGNKRLSKVMKIDVQVVWRGVFFSSCCVEECFLMGVAVAPRCGGSGDLVEDSREPISRAGVLKQFESIPRVAEQASEYLLNMLLYRATSDIW